MLTEKQLQELKEHLEKAQKPVFYYDNDCDGLCSFLLLRRYLGRGKGVAVRSFPDLNAGYARKARELNADAVFVLDKPVVSREFIEEISRLGLPLIWIDHHDVGGKELRNEFHHLFVYNPTWNESGEKSEEPVTYWARRLTMRDEDLWLGVIGCIADHFLPDFASIFGKRYVEFWGNVKEPFDAYYRTEIGRIAQAFNFGLKDSTTNIVHLQNFLIQCKGPEEVFLEVNGNYSFRKKYQEIRKKYDSLVVKAKQALDNGALFFDYGGDLSISADIANELCYFYPQKYIAVAYKKEGVSNISLRGRNVKKILERILAKLEHASGGGHDDAVGARIQTKDVKKFREFFLEEVENERSTH